jgi:ectoine hydroxylase-related dioxygenase (phytanoyl-CoA dioxygenase family)
VGCTSTGWMMDRVESWNTTQLKGERSTGQVRVTQKQRFKLDGPFFCDPVISENPLVLELLERLWGDDDIELNSYSSNCPAPGTVLQNRHRDGMLLGANLALPVYPCLSLKFPLVDTTEENGSTEIIPSTHHCSIPELNHIPGSETARRVVSSGQSVAAALPDR